MHLIFPKEGPHFIKQLNLIRYKGDLTGCAGIDLHSSNIVIVAMIKEMKLPTLPACLETFFGPFNGPD